jgi:hypothetical protein
MTHLDLPLEQPSAQLEHKARQLPQAGQEEIQRAPVQAGSVLAATI